MPIFLWLYLNITPHISKALNITEGEFMSDDGMVLDEVDNFIVKIIKKEGKPVSTYNIAKIGDISWATANSHCYKLKSLGVLDGKFETGKIGARKKVIWWLKKEKEA